MENEKKQDKSILDRVQSAFTGTETIEKVENNYRKAFKLWFII